MPTTRSGTKPKPYKSKIDNEQALKQLEEIGYSRSPRAFGESPGAASSSDESSDEDEWNDWDERTKDLLKRMPAGLGLVDYLEWAKQNLEDYTAVEEDPVRRPGVESSFRKSREEDEDSEEEESQSMEGGQSKSPPLSLECLLALVEAHLIRATAKKDAVAAASKKLTKFSKSRRGSRNVPESAQKEVLVEEAMDFEETKVEVDSESESGLGVEGSQYSRLDTPTPLARKGPRISKLGMTPPNNPLSRSSSIKLKSSSPMSFSLTPDQSPRPTRILSPSPSRAFSPSELDFPIPSLLGLISTIRFPNSFNLVLRSRNLHRRLEFIFSSAQNLLLRYPSFNEYEVEQSLAQHGGITSMSWIKFLKFYRLEQELNLLARPSFHHVFVEGTGIDPPISFWMAYVQHVAVQFKLCKCTMDGAAGQDRRCSLHNALVYCFSHKSRAGEEVLEVPEGASKHHWKEFERFWARKRKESKCRVDWDKFRLAEQTEQWSLGLTPRTDGGIGWMGTVCFLLPILRLVTSSPTPLSEVTATLQRIQPSLSFSDVLRLGLAVQSNPELVQLSAHQRTERYGRELDGNILRLSNLAFADSPQSSSSATINARVIRTISNATDSLAALAPPRRILCTSVTCCRQCGGVLRIRGESTPIFLLNPSSVESASLVRHCCSNVDCEAVHFPGFIDLKINDRVIRLYDSEPVYFRLGRTTWADRAFLIHFIALVENHHVAFSTYATTFSNLYRPSSSSNWSLSHDQLWRGFVIFNSTALAKQSGKRFASLAGAVSAAIVSLSLGSFLSSTAIPTALDHCCPECSRYKREWKDPGLEPREEIPRKKRKAAELNAKKFVEDTNVDRSRIIKLAVMDGVDIGHFICAYPGCPNPPLDYQQRRFCASHEVYSSLCGIFGCGRPQVEGSDACEELEHQDIWKRDQAKKGRENLRGYRRIIRNWRKIRPERDDEEEKTTEGSPLVTMFSYRRIDKILVLVAACGTPLGWTKIRSDEDVAEILAFLDSICEGNRKRLPSFIAYDRACSVIRQLVPNPEWLETVQFICDAFHFRGHSLLDEVCRTYCDPEPVDASAPDLVVPLVEETSEDEDGSKSPGRIFRRAFNTEAAEQLNSWLAGFGPILRQKIPAANFKSPR